MELSQQGLASRTAAALDEPFPVGVVVVSQLFAATDCFRGTYPDRAVNNVNVAVRPARVIDESCDVAADAGVDDAAVGQLETPDVSLTNIPTLALETLMIRNSLARVVHDPCVLRDWSGRVHSPALDFGFPSLDHQN